MTKIGLIGCGAVADYAHIPAIKGTQGFDLTSIFDVSLANAHRLAKKHHIEHVFDNVDRFFESGIDAVVITSSAPAHKQNVLDAARYKKPVLCEKPLALTNADSQVMIAAMKEAGVPLYTAFCYRFSPSAMKIRELVQAGVIGDVRSLRLIYDWDLHGRYEIADDGKKVLSKRRVGRMLEGGPMIDCGTHQIDLAQWWLQSDVVHTTGVGAWVDDYEAPDHMYLHMDHAGGQHTMVEISFSYGAHVKDPCPVFCYELIGTDGVIRYDRGFRSFEVRTPNNMWHEEWHEEKNFPGMYAEFAKALATGEPGDLATAETGRIVAQIAERGTAQAIANRPVLK
ncbi:MAG TPA: Gfo/Idh/MocA family oxidoreductase [Capsulimonadaceae bacterium]|jgi:predicted dehydrogenase